jgi:ribonuclease BN (tRNA processing enzyme)
MSNNRRAFIRKSIILSTAAGLGISSKAKENYIPPVEGDRLVLLGTQGGPFIRSYQQTPSSNVIVYKDIHFVIDAGYGTTFKLREAGINLSRLNYIFITHLHSDHYLDLGPLLYNAWVAGLSEPVHIYGPAGIESLLKFYWKSNEFDINTRIKDEERTDIKKLIVVHEIKEGMIMSIPGIETSALRNIHPPIHESFALRFKLGEKLIVFSGDTAYYTELAAFASNADYLLHEVMYPDAVDEMAKRRPGAAKLIQSIKSHHTSAENVGRIATTAHVKNLVLTHFVPPDDKSLTEQKWIDAVSRTFPGSIIVGKDMLTLAI